MSSEKIINLPDTQSKFQKHLRPSLYNPSEPLWKRVPTRDSNGQPFHDFMMIIPGLKTREEHVVREVIGKMEAVLKHYEKDVILADLNLKLNVLWVTVQPRKGICVEIASMIHHTIPEAKLVAQQYK